MNCRMWNGEKQHSEQRMKCFNDLRRLKAKIGLTRSAIVVVARDAKESKKNNFFQYSSDLPFPDRV